MTSSVDPDQTPQNAASDMSLYCSLPEYLVGVGVITGRKSFISSINNSAVHIRELLILTGNVQNISTHTFISCSRCSAHD